MSTNSNRSSASSKRIVIIKNGPYCVEGDVPLVAKTQVVSEHGEPLTWQKIGEIDAGEGEYHLCRCGQSSNRPFCDGTHRKVGFDGTETAFVNTFDQRALTVPNGYRIIIKKDPNLCMKSGFCGLQNAGFYQLVSFSRDTKYRSLVIAMIERCPSGALTYRMEADGPDIEPDLQPQIAVTTEITSDGPIAGPLWVTGSIEVIRSDGKPFEKRNRITLCNCGHSCKKPLCDGTHRERAEQEARERRG